MIFLKAYLEKNFGDDLFVDIITSRYKNTKFLMIAPREYKRIFTATKNLIIINSDNIFFRAINHYLRKFGINARMESILSHICAGSVYIGGSIFIQPTAKHKKELISFRNFINKKFTAVLSCNFGPFKDSEFSDEYFCEFKKITDICFRDRLSYDLFSKLSNVRYAPDIAFTLPHSIASPDKQFFISVIELNNHIELRPFRDSYIKKIVEISLHFIKKGYKVSLASFCKNEGDEQMLDSITSVIPEEYIPSIKQLRYNGDIQGFIYEIQSSEYVIASRFHAMILSLVYSKKTLPLSYSTKFTNALDSYFSENNCIQINQTNKIDITSIESFFMIYKPAETEKLKKDAQGQFDVLDKLLN